MLAASNDYLWEGGGPVRLSEAAGAQGPTLTHDGDTPRRLTSQGTNKPPPATNAGT